MIPFQSVRAKWMQRLLRTLESSTLLPSHSNTCHKSSRIIPCSIKSSRLEEYIVAGLSETERVADTSKLNKVVEDQRTKILLSKARRNFAEDSKSAAEHPTSGAVASPVCCRLVRWGTPRERRTLRIPHAVPHRLVGILSNIVRRR